MKTITGILLMSPPQGEGDGMSSMIMLALIFVVAYFFMIRPQMKKQKTQKKFRDELKKGDKIVTIGGIHGKILDVKEHTVTIEVGGSVQLRIEKSAIAHEFSEELALNKAA